MHCPTKLHFFLSFSSPCSPELEEEAANGGVSILALLEVDEVTGEVVEVEVGDDRFRLLLLLFFGL